MTEYRQQIQEYKKELQKNCFKKEEQTIQACQNIVREQIYRKQSLPMSYFEFLYEQSKFIKKKWWILQGCVLLFLWIWLRGYASDMEEMMRLVGIFATVFVILIVPEIWKNRRNGAIEIEQAAYYTLRQICAARMLLFAVVDFTIIMLFFVTTYSTTAIPLSPLIINFLLPVNVSCCICFRLLYSRWEKSEYVAIFLCLIWVAVWMMIVTNDGIYQKIAIHVWVMMLLLTFAYFIYCVRKSLMFNEKLLEDYTYEIRI